VLIPIYFLKSKGYLKINCIGNNINFTVHTYIRIQTHYLHFSFNAFSSNVSSFIKKSYQNKLFTKINYHFYTIKKQYLVSLMATTELVFS